MTNQYYSLAITDGDELFSWGSNKDGRLGHLKDKGEIIQNPKRYDFFSNNYLKVIDTSCGNSHIAVVACSKDESNDGTGSVYTWGLPLYGRLGYIHYKHDRKETKVDNYDNLEYTSEPKKLEINQKIVRVFCGEDFSACLTEKGKIFTWGTNKWGNLGVENKNFDNEPNVINLPTEIMTFVNKTVIQVACGSKHMMCLTTENKVYSWGSGENGILGHGNTYGLNKPQMIKEFQNEEIIFVAAGSFNSAAINVNGNLFTWGRGKYGILAQGSEEDILIPKKVKEGNLDKEKVFFVSLGFYHTVCLTIEANTFAWGYSEKGRLGCVEKSDCDQKKRILSPREIHSLRGNQLTQVVCGHFHTLAVTREGKVWGWGENVDYILGPDDNLEENTNEIKKMNKKTISYKPKELSLCKNLYRITNDISDIYEIFFKFVSKKNNIDTTIKETGKIKRFACGGSFTLAITDTGLLYSWGYGDHGQLGLKAQKYLYDPTLLDLGSDRKVVKIYTGYAHAMAITDTSEVYLWGDGSSGQLGVNKTKSDEPFPVDELAGKNVKKGACGHDNSAVITSESKVYVWGSNTSNKLGIKSQNPYEFAPKLLEELHSIEKISLGHNHSAAINTNKELFTWGHGFFGQLGHGGTNSISTPKKVEYMYTKFHKVKCGYYHTCAIDNKKKIYIWGRKKYNLSSDKDKDKPEPIDEFKNQSIKSIQVGQGFTVFLNDFGEIYCYGDNQHNRANCGTKETEIVKAPLLLQLTKDASKRITIKKIFSGFFHNFAITADSEYLCWGNSKGYRLSKKCMSDQFEIPLSFPPPGEHAALSGNPESKDENQDLNTTILKASQRNLSMLNNTFSKNSELEERRIFEIINENKNLDFTTVVNLIRNLNDKYEDHKLDEQDQEIESSIRKALEKLYVNRDFEENVSKSFFEFEKVLNYRMIKEIRPYYEPATWVETFFKRKNNFINMNEIQIIYNLFFLHPCIFRDFFAVDDDETNFVLTKNLLKGFQPLFREMNTYSKRCMSIENVIYLNFFNMLLDVWISKVAKNQNLNADNIFDDDNSFLADFIEIYFYDELRRSIFYDIFEKGLRDLNMLAKNKKQINMKPNQKSEESIKIAILEKIFDFNSMQDENKIREINKEKDFIKILLTHTKTFILDLQSNIKKLPIQIRYIFTKLRKRLKRLFIGEKSKSDPNFKKDIKDKITRSLLKFFLKNIIGEKLKVFSNERKAYFCWYFNIPSNLSSDNYFETLKDYLKIIGTLIGIIGMKLNYKAKSNNESTEGQNNLSELNQNIELIYDIIFNNFKFYMLKQRFEFKKEALTSTIFHNANLNIKKVKIDFQIVEELIRNLKSAIKKKKSGGSQILNKDDFIILKDGPDDKIKDSDSAGLNQNKISIRNVTVFIDTKFLRNFKGFQNRLKAKEKDYDFNEENREILRCEVCSAIVPKAFININNIEKNTLIKRFYFKAQKCWRYTSVIKNPNFSKSVIYDNINKLIDNVNNCAGVQDNAVAEIARKIRAYLDTAITKSQNQNISVEQVFNEFTSDLIKHIKMQIKHYNKLKKWGKITNDIHDAREEYSNRTNALFNDLELSKKSLIAIQDFNFSITEKEEVDKLRSELSINGKNIALIRGDGLKFKQINLGSFYIDKYFIMNQVDSSTQDFDHASINCIRKNDSFEFSIKLRKKSGDDINLAVTLEEFLYNLVNSSCISSMIKGNVKIKLYPFLALINDNIEQQ